ncbi:MAG: hypothetical protein AAGF84_05745 [Planctomycetota bacterium]
MGVQQPFPSVGSGRMEWFGCVGIARLLPALLTLLIVAWLPVTAISASESVATEPTVKQRVASILDDIESTGEIQFAEQRAVDLLVEVALTHPTSDQQAFSEAGFLLELVRLLRFAKDTSTTEALSLLRKHPEAMRELAYLLYTANDGDHADAALALFARLDRAFGEDVDAFPGLTAALCVVFDEPVEHRINENRAYAPDPVDLFRYYRDNESKMMFGIRDLPGRLLIWVVDSTQSIDDMHWALDKYAGDRSVGRRFFDIRYDYDHLRRGTPKKITSEGFTLPNILKYGGVCADQAYFATQVAKAIGVPATYTWGQSGEVAHAWVGYLERVGRHGVSWNFEQGRYSAYQGVRGNARNPQSGEFDNDSVIGLTAETITLPPLKRRAAFAMLRAEATMHKLSFQDDFEKRLAQIVEASGRSALRTGSREDRLALLEASIRLDVSGLRAWSRVAANLQEEQITTATRRHWGNALVNLCAERYPDFMVEMLFPILRTLDSDERQIEVWDAALKKVRHRSDLSAWIRITQGRLWERMGNPSRAAASYEDVVRKHANDGPYVLYALQEYEQLLQDAGRPERIPLLYREAFGEMDLPDRSASQFARQSNYYKVGSLYVEKLREAGDQRTAERIATKIAQVTGLAVAGG